jgi:tetratricopeptide (TPR) repeat protein
MTLKAYFEIGKSLMDDGQYISAVHYFDRAINENSQNYAAFENRSRCKYLIGKENKELLEFALKDLQMAIKITAGTAHADFPVREKWLSDINEALEKL